jgi:hypothetical protein
MDVGRLGLRSPGMWLAAYVVLAWLLLVYYRTVLGAANEHIPLMTQVFGTLVATGLAWLVWRRSRTVWGLLLAWNAVGVMLIYLGADQWEGSLVGFLSIVVGQIVTLLAPAVRHHAWRRAPQPATR